ncbi:MFS transporter [Kineococcus sp. SYSU DK005]|uniref:MFS transporter n=1 Tax=Kineococcus sp. SYSU DK005 TaxID=3383126 RepID=UPI003D7D5298
MDTTPPATPPSAPPNTSPAAPQTTPPAGASSTRLAASGEQPTPSRSHARGFWLIALVFAVGMAFSTVPTPLWPLYRTRDGLSTTAVTIAFAAYAVGVAVSLYLVGHVSDRIGRRRVLMPAIVLELLAASVLLLAHDLAVLVLARLLTGLGVGVLTATATAHLTELHAAARPGASTTRASVVATAANLGGLALGPLVAGVLASAAPAPLTTSYALFLVLLAAAGVAVALVPETVPRTDERYRWRPQRVVVPAAARGRYAALGAVTFALFAVFGLFTSLAPAFLATTGVTAPVLAGLASTGVFAAAATSQVLLGRLPVQQQLTAGFTTLAAGVLVLAGGELLGSAVAFVVGGLVAGSGAGVLLKGVLASAAAMAPAGAHGEAVAGVFLIAYLGLALPVLGIGAASAAGISLSVSLLTLACGVLLLVGIGWLALRRTTPR